ncbi:MAG: bacteriohemerythrin [Nanoarchaeota archaeon]
MAFIKWDRSLSVGIKEIDDQHKYLIETINNANKDLESLNKKAIKKLLNDLLDYVRLHFSTEERYFEKHDYPGIKKHMEEHALLIEKVIHYADKFEQGRNIVPELIVFLRDWLEDHLKTEDHEYALFFKEIGVSKL